jgi:hypothetical protein
LTHGLTTLSSVAYDLSPVSSCSVCSLAAHWQPKTFAKTTRAVSGTESEAMPGA